MGTTDGTRLRPRPALLDWHEARQAEADAQADEIAARWEQGLRTDARLVASWLCEQGIHPALIARDATSWTDFDWRVIEDETGIRCSVTVRNHVLDLLGGAS